MKSILIAVAILMTHPVQADTYCRTVRSNPKLPQPKGVRKHCIVLDYSTPDLTAGQLRDNGPTFFGNPPLETSFRLESSSVLVLESNHWVKRYQLENNDFDLRDQSGNILLFQGE